MRNLQIGVNKLEGNVSINLLLHMKPCKISHLCISITRQMLAASWGKPEACQHPIVLFCARDYSIDAKAKKIRKIRCKVMVAGQKATYMYITFIIITSKCNSV